MQCLNPVSQLTICSIHSICSRIIYSASGLVRYAICSQITLVLFSEIDLLFRVKRFRSLHLLEKRITFGKHLYFVSSILFLWKNPSLSLLCCHLRDVSVVRSAHNLVFGLCFSPQDELKLAVKQGATLLTCIREPVTRSANSKLSPDELENVATVERSVKLDYPVQLAHLFLGAANVI